MLSVQAEKARILVVDDHPVVWHGINLLLNRQDDLACCPDEVDTVAGILPAVMKDHPQMLLLDLNLRDGNALNIIGTLRDQFPDVSILVISQFDNIQYAEDALQAGAVGYVMKEEAAQEILTAIRTVLRKETYISRKLNLTASSQAAPMQRRPAAGNHVDEDEFQVFLLLGSGLSMGDIAAQLKISVETLGARYKKLKDKLKLTDDAELANYAFQCKCCFDAKGADAAAAFFQCALRLECCEWGKPAQFEPAPAGPRPGFPGKPRQS
jgi:DNA-binding NarL/FixJ family response regulator